ncbi:MAG: hypothetical protein LAO79_22510 [Acidobacteriia bacterium]|nr:hypothetical protein [Terriglobia bacterium]
MTPLIKKLWSESAALTFCAALMLAAFVASAVGIFVDPRIITGVPAWLKPAKFAISTAIFAATVAWLYQYITIWPRFKRVSGWLLAIILIVEVGLIDVQAARGTTSHFNAATPADAAIFGVMGIAIAVLLVISVVMTYVLFRQPFAHRAWGWSLRLGALVYVLGAASAGFMIGPKPDQMEALKAHQKVAVIGGHTVGASDGGPGLPGVGWSEQHGDLRIPHFFGLHALQAIPFLGWLVVRARRGVRMVFAGAASYLAFTGILTWQALRGQSMVEPDAATLTAFAIWAAATLLAVFLSSKGTEQYEPGTPVLSV